jgi:hypothetical protein
MKSTTGNFFIYKIIFLKAKRVEMLLDEVRDAESVVFTYRKDLKEMGMRLKQQHNLYQVCISFVSSPQSRSFKYIFNSKKYEFKNRSRRKRTKFKLV